MELSQVLGWTATTLFTGMFIPQIYKTWKTKKVEDISLPMFLTGFVANIIAFCYATLIHQQPLQIKYTLALIAIGIYLWIYFKIRGKK